MARPRMAGARRARFISRRSRPCREISPEFSVRFYKREPVVDVWTWDDAMLESGKRLIGFFFFDEYGNLGVRKDGRKNVINNVEQIDRDLLLQLQSQFTTPLFEEPETSAEVIEDHS